MAGLLVCYTLGYTTPVLLAGVLSGSARSMATSLQGGFDWVAPVSGSLLLALGTYNALSSVLGAA